MADIYELFKTIWVIDDNIDHSELLINTINDVDSRYHIEHKGNGEIALIDLKRRFSENKTLPNLIFMDIKMPRLNGIETLQAIKCHHGLQHIPIAMLSTSTNEYEIQQCLRGGAILYLSKPLTVTYFKQHILPVIEQGYKPRPPST